MAIHIAEARRMYDIRGLGCDALADKKKTEVGQQKQVLMASRNASSTDNPDMSRSTFSRRAKAIIQIRMAATATKIQQY